MPWTETEDYMSGDHENTDNHDKDSIRTIEFDTEKGIKATVGCHKATAETAIVKFASKP